LFERTPVWSPDGRHILVVGSCGNEVISAWTSTPDGKTLKANHDLDQLWTTLVEFQTVDQWSANPSRLLVPQSYGDGRSIVAVPLTVDGTRVAGPSSRLTFGTGNETGAFAALNGRIVLSEETRRSHIWGLPIDRRGAAAGTRTQITSNTAGEEYPAVSRDGEKLAYISVRANGKRLFWRDLSTGHDTEVSDDGYWLITPVFSFDGTRLMYTRYPFRESWRASIYEAQLSNGGIGERWGEEKWSWLFDWAPDGSTLLMWHLPSSYDPFHLDQRSFPILQLDLHSLSTTTFLKDAEYGVAGARFSHDGRWVAFSAAKDDYARVAIVPFRKAQVPRGEWNVITEPDLDSRPVHERPPAFSFNDRVLFFTSRRDGFRCLWAQPLRPDMHPDGGAFAVHHFHQLNDSLQGLTVGPTKIFFDVQETKGNIWLLEPRSTAPQPLQQ
jgi:hypothetical protein